MTNYTLGMDVSTWQEYVNWPVAVDKGVRFAYIRGAYGVTKDNKFDLHWGSSKGKLLRGVYLYYRDSQDPVQQADNLYAYCEAHGDFGELPPALDIEEYNNAQITPAKVKTCLERLEANFGIKPLVYTAQAVWDKWLGNVAWATEYDLWCSNPPWSKWFDGLIEAAKALDPNVWPHKPLPWKNAGLMQVIWQITFKAPASDYGVSGSELDLNFFSGTEAELYEYANGTINPPPPDPIGEIVFPETTVTATVTLLPAGMTYRNCRTRPDSTGGDAGLVEGKVYLNQSYPCWQQVVNSEGTWYLVQLPDKSFGWVLAIVNGVVYLTLTQEGVPAPLEVKYMQTVTNTNLRWYTLTNAQGKPIMAMPPAENRPKFLAGSVVVVKPDIVDADGTEDYYEVLSGGLANPPTYQPPANYTGWFIRKNDVFQV